MDIRTLTIVTCVCAATMAATLGVMSRLAPGDRCLKDWTAAALLFLANSSFGVIGLSYPLQAHAIIVGIANASTVAGYTLMLSGTRLYLGRPHAHRVALMLGAMVLVLNLLPGMRDHLEWRLLLGWPIIVVTQFAIVFELLRERRQLAKPAMKLLLVLTLVYASQQLLRLVLLAQALLQGDPVNPDHGLFTAGRLLLFTYLLLSTVACALLIIQDKAEALKRLADIDPLTGWHNRRSWEAVMDAEFQRSRRTGAGFHVVTFDIDHFKKVNDRHGHDVGDQAIRHVATVVAQELRAYDHRFRIGGEEFVVCAPGLQAATLAQRICARVAALPLPLAEGELRITVSVGYSDRQADDADWHQVARRADQALYRAKGAGRNRAEGVGAPASDLARA